MPSKGLQAINRSHSVHLSSETRTRFVVGLESCLIPKDTSALMGRKQLAGKCSHLCIPSIFLTLFQMYDFKVIKVKRRRKSSIA